MNRERIRWELREEVYAALNPIFFSEGIENVTFEEWMRAHHYRAGTIKQTVSDLRRVLSNSEDVNTVNALRRYVSYANEVGVDDQYIELAQNLGLAGVRKTPQEKVKTRKKIARSFEEDDWKTLRSAVAQSKDPRDQVIWAMVTTALRISDVLRVPLTVLSALDEKSPILYIEEKGGYTRPLPLHPETVGPWVALRDGIAAAGVPNVAQYVCRGATSEDVRGSCAYQKVNRRIKALKRQLKLEGRAHAHRIRRTVAVRALEQDPNLRNVQELLGHRSLQTTLKYLDEARLRQVAELQRKLNQDDKGDKGDL